MTNAGMIEALRYCNGQECSECPLRGEPTSACLKMLRDAADALEAADKRIARLEEDLKTREAEREVLQDTIKICEEAADRYKTELEKRTAERKPADGYGVMAARMLE